MRRIERDEHRQRVGIMLRLREQIGRNDCRGGRGVGENDQLRRARKHVDRNATRDELFRRRDVAISGTRNHVARRDRARAESQRRNCLCAARREQTVGAGDGRGGERHRSRLGARNPDLLHARRPRGHRRHQH